MTPLTLYEGCFVKTLSGKICGPLDEGLWFDGSRWHETGYYNNRIHAANQLPLCEVEENWSAIAIYPSLSAAAAANPEM